MFLSNPKPLSAYVGGKFRLAPKLIDLMPPHSWYMEVFAGMASVFLAKSRYGIERTIINDINSNIVNLFRVVRDNTDEFLRLVELTPYSSEEFYRFLDKYNSEFFYELSDVERAFIYYYILRNAFNSNLVSQTFTTSHIGASRWASDETLINIRNFARFCQGVEFTNYSYDVLLTFPWIKENAQKWLIYCDPPYYISTEKNDYYEYRFSHEDHLKLYEILCDLRDAGCKIMVSYDDHPFIRDLYKDWNLTVIANVVQSSSSREGTPVDRNELVFTSYHIYELGLFGMTFSK